MRQEGNRDILNFAEKNENKFVKMKNEMQSLGMIKVEFAVVVKMAKKNENGEMTHFNKYMKNEAWVFQNENEDEIREKVMKFVDEVNNRIESCVENGSEILFEKVETAYVNVSNYEPLLVGTYMPLPKKLQNMQESNDQRAEQKRRVSEMVNLSGIVPCAKGQISMQNNQLSHTRSDQDQLFRNYFSNPFQRPRQARSAN